MHSSILTLATAAHLVGISAAATVEHQHQQFYRWNSPPPELNIYRRQGPLPGYHPEFGTCGSGTTCENACGSNWELCEASTSLSLFCYNKVDLGQTCCKNGSGRACERGYYCAWNEFGGKTWCCKDGQSLEECGVTSISSSADSSMPTTSTTTITLTDSSSTSPTSCPSVSVVTVTDTKTVTISQPSGGGSHDTVTSTVTVTVPGGTITAPGPTVIIPKGTVTITAGTITLPGETVTITTPGVGGQCSSSTVLPPPSYPYIHDTTTRATVTTEVACSITDKPYCQGEVTPSPSWSPEPSGNITSVVTTTSSIVTAGALKNDLPRWGMLGMYLVLIVVGSGMIIL
ncbi:hypothetical protein V8F20_008295 [Naviculisporaceae sp. PSN 640]